MDDSEWGEKPEIVAFKEVYSVNIIVYDKMSSHTLLLRMKTQLIQYIC